MFYCSLYMFEIYSCTYFVSYCKAEFVGRRAYSVRVGTDRGQGMVGLSNSVSLDILVSLFLSRLTLVSRGTGGISTRGLNRICFWIS